MFIFQRYFLYSQDSSSPRHISFLVTFTLQSRFLFNDPRRVASVTKDIHRTRAMVNLTDNSCIIQSFFLCQYGDVMFGPLDPTDTQARGIGYLTELG